MVVRFSFFFPRSQTLLCLPQHTLQNSVSRTALSSLLFSDYSALIQLSAELYLTVKKGQKKEAYEGKRA